MSGVKSVSRHEEASAGGGSFAQQGGLIARQNLAICVSKTTCHATIVRLSIYIYIDIFVIAVLRKIFFK